MKANVLIVDDDPALRRALVDRFLFWGHAAEEASDGEAALLAAGRKQFDLILLDLTMPGLPGLTVLKKLREQGSESDVVVLTAHGSLETAVEAVKAGAQEFLQKPADFEILKTIIERSLERNRLKRVNLAMADRIDRSAAYVLGQSEAMRKLLETASRAAQSKATLLITGESGSGKQVLAEFVHQKSGMKDGPFVYVNCVALSDDLIESTLFGHEKGAFTGAVAKKAGRLETAAGGTAFLDEVGDITGRLQTKLLHFLETGQFERVGGTRTLAIECRIIAATNRDLKEAIREGRFREDLFYRLNVIELHVPPLRERREDIPVLASAFLERFAGELNRRDMKLSRPSLDILENYSWPGNVRQLRNAMERMVVLAPGNTLTPDLLPPEVLSEPGRIDLERADLPLKEAMRQFEKNYIARVLAQTAGNQTRAAEVLGLQRTYLNKLLKDLELARPSDAGE